MDLDFSQQEGEYYIALQFKDEDATKLLHEREAIWRVLGKLGNFSIDAIPWMKRLPEVRLAYIPTDGDITNPHGLADSIGEAVDEALPFDVVLAPAYDEPLRIQS